MSVILLPTLAFVATVSLVLFFAYDLLFETPLERAAAKILGVPQREPSRLGDKVVRILDRKDDLTIARRLASAGFDWSPARFWFLATLPSFAGATIVAISSGNAVAAAGVGLIMSIVVPRLALAWLERRRGTLFQSQLPSAVEVIVRGARSGLALNECVRLVATEGQEPIASEFQSILREQAIGRTLAEAFQIVARRIGSPEAHMLATVIQVQAQTGGNVAEILEGLAESLRSREMLRDRVKTITAESRISAYILAVLPFAAFKIVDGVFPEKTRLLFETPSGNLVLLGLVVWMGIGIGLVFKMVNMKV